MGLTEVGCGTQTRIPILKISPSGFVHKVSTQKQCNHILWTKNHKPEDFDKLLGPALLQGHLGIMARSSIPSELLISIHQMALILEENSKVFGPMDMSRLKVSLRLNYHENDVLGVSLGD